MAVSVCEVCDGDLAAVAVSCPTCRSPVVRAAPRAPRMGSAAEVPVEQATVGATCSTEGCGHVNQPGEIRCFYCSTPLRQPGPAAAKSAGAGVARLLLPWGEAVVSAGECLVIGRDEPTLREHLSSYDNVSRQHARLTHDGALTVVDLNSTNGTTVNGRRVTSGEPVVLRDGDELGFGADLRARVLLA